MFRRRCWQAQSTTFFLVSLTIGVDKWQVPSPTKRWPQGSRLKDQDQTTISSVSFKLCEQVCLIHSTFYYIIDNHTLRFGSDITVLYQTMRCCDRFVVTFGWSQSYHLCPTPKNKQRAKSGQKQGGTGGAVEYWKRCHGICKNCKPHWRWLKFIYTTNHITTMTKQRWRRRQQQQTEQAGDILGKGRRAC